MLRLPDDCDEVAIIARGRADAGSVALLLARRRAARLAAWYACVQDDNIKPAFHKLRVCPFLCCSVERHLLILQANLSF